VGYFAYFRLKSPLFDRHGHDLGCHGLGCLECWLDSFVVTNLVSPLLALTRYLRVPFDWNGGLKEKFGLQLRSKELDSGDRAP